MSIYKKGDILSTEAEFIMIPVNIEGTLTDKVFEIYPQLHKQYVSICELYAKYNNSAPHTLLGNILPYITKDNKHILLCFCNAQDKYFDWAFENCCAKITSFLREININLIAGHNNEFVSSAVVHTFYPASDNCWDYYDKAYFSPKRPFSFENTSTNITLEVWND